MLVRFGELALSLLFFGILEVELSIYTALVCRVKKAVSVLVNAKGLASLVQNFSPLGFVL